MTKVFVLVKQTFDAFSNTELEVEVFPTLEAVIEDVHNQYFDFEEPLFNEDGDVSYKEFWEEVRTALTNDGHYLDEDGNDPIEWHIYEREF